MRLRFCDLMPGEKYHVVAGDNDTFILGSTIQIAPDNQSIWTSNAAEIGGYRQSAWIDLSDLCSQHYNGVLFEVA